MRAELHKVTFQVHGVFRDDDDRIVDDFAVGGGVAPDGRQVEFLLREHELDRLPGEVAAVLVQLAAQAEPQTEAEHPQNGNRAQRHAVSRKPKAKPAAN